MLFGCDVSKWQANRVDFSKYDFVIMKASEGKTLKDKYLDAHYDRLHGSKDGKPDEKKLYGFYHYAHPENNTPEEEAEFFLSLVGHHAGHCLFVLDWEGKALKQPISWARKWLDIVYKKTGVKPLIYVQGSYTKNLQIIKEGDYGLWVAHYNPKGGKPTIGVYDYWALWQYTSVPLDRDYFNGTAEQFKKYCSKSK